MDPQVVQFEYVSCAQWLGLLWGGGLQRAATKKGEGERERDGEGERIRSGTEREGERERFLFLLTTNVPLAWRGLGLGGAWGLDKRHHKDCNGSHRIKGSAQVNVVQQIVGSVFARCADYVREARGLGPSLRRIPTQIPKVPLRTAKDF